MHAAWLDGVTCGDDTDGSPAGSDTVLDTRSVEASAAQSETASSVSRTAFSLGDKTELDVRETAALAGLLGANPPPALGLQPAALNEDGTLGWPVTNRAAGKKRSHLRSAFVRELLLSSLSL